MDLAQFAQALSRADQLTDLLDGLSEAIYLVDGNRTILFWNQACERLTGYEAKDVVGHRCYEDILRHIDQQGQQLCWGLCPLAITIQDGQPRRCQVWLHHRDGHRLPVQIAVRPVRNAQGEIIGALEAFTDASTSAATRARLREMERLAMIDPLTDIPNRRFLEMSLASRLAEVRRYGRSLSVALLDIDKFKTINDTHGHQTGDAALKMIAKLLVANARGEDVIARIRGDEFVILLQNADPRGAASLPAATDADRRQRSRLPPPTRTDHRLDRRRGGQRPRRRPVSDGPRRRPALPGKADAQHGDRRLAASSRLGG
ncbi:MAG: diguanylate cyclase [Solirubrobacteraceae bacterium]